MKICQDLEKYIIFAHGQWATLLFDLDCRWDFRWA